jgi:hypothetical protein
MDKLERISDAEYFSRAGLNSTKLKKFATSPLHLKSYEANPPKSSKAFDIGRIAHSLILEDEKSWAVVEGDRRKKDVKEAVLEAEGDGLIVIKGDEEKDVFGMQLAVQCHETGMVITSDPDRAELSGFATCPETGLLLKAKYDWLPYSGPKIFDLKTTKAGGADKRKFEYAVRDFGYDIQFAHYTYVSNLLGLNKDSMVFIVVEKEAPYATSAFEFGEERKAMYMENYMNLLRKYAKCLAEDDFTECYPQGIQVIK